MLVDSDSLSIMLLVMDVLTALYVSARGTKRVKFRPERHGPTYEIRNADCQRPLSSATCTMMCEAGSCNECGGGGGVVGGRLGESRLCSGPEDYSQAVHWASDDELAGMSVLVRE